MPPVYSIKSNAYKSSSRRTLCGLSCLLADGTMELHRLVDGATVGTRAYHAQAFGDGNAGGSKTASERRS